MIAYVMHGSTVVGKIVWQINVAYLAAGSVVHGAVVGCL